MTGDRLPKAGAVRELVAALQLLCEVEAVRGRCTGASELLVQTHSSDEARARKIHRLRHA